MRQKFDTATRIKNLEDKNAAIEGENEALQKMLNTMVSKVPPAASNRKECFCNICDGIFCVFFSVGAQPVVIFAILLYNIVCCLC